MPSRNTTPRQPADRHLRLRTLGDASLDLLSADGVVTEHQEMSKALALVTYLACAPTRKESREHLVDLLWSDLEVEAGQHALRQHLWLLKRRFGDVLTPDRKNVSRTGAAIDIDRDALLAAANRGDCAAVVDLYRGEFFLGFAAPGSNEFERWTDLERARLRAVFVRCAGQLVREWLSAGRARDGQSLARRIRDAEPFAQHSWRLLLESHISGGDYLGASVEADAFEQLLSIEEMDAEPASRALIAAAHRGSTTTVGTAPAPFSDLVGRETEFGWLMKAWNSATAGSATCVHIVAPAGFGKTRLLQDFRSRLASLRARVVVARADAGSGSIPLSFLSDLVTALGAVPGAGGVTLDVATVLVGLAPSLAATYPAARVTAGQTDEPHVRRSAIRDLLTAIAEDRPLALLVDDLHWSDRESSSLLAAAIGALAKQRLLIVVAQRPTGITPTFQADAQQFALAPLSESAIAALLANVARLPAAAWSDALAAELRRTAGGSPLLVIETLQLATQRDVLSVVDGEWRCSDTHALTALLQAGGAVRHRVERLGPHEQAIARLLSIAQVPLPFDVLCTASRLPIDELSAVLATLERLGLVRHAQDQWAIGHDEYAAATLSLLSPDVARAVHSALGHALRDSTEVTERQRHLSTRHLRLADEWESLHAPFERLACDSAKRGDRRSLTRLATEFLGTDASPADAERLVSGLPLDIRIGLVTPTRKAAAVFATAIPLAALWLALTPAAAPRPTPDHVALIVDSDGAGGSIIQELPFSDRLPAGDSTIVIHGPGAKSVHIPQTYGGPAPSPANPDEWLTAHAVADSGMTDLFLVNSKTGAEQRLTFARGDDIDPIWSPDARLIVFATSRWSALGHTSLAVLDRHSRVVRRLTSSDGSDAGPFWSPDGSHVAFNRRTFNAKDAICTVRFDGNDARCRETTPSAATVGWISDSVLLVASSTPPDFTLTRLNMRSGARYFVGHLATPPSLSPDGRWLACDCRAEGDAQPRVLLIQSDDLAVQRRVVITDSRSARPDFQWRRSGSPRYVNAIALVRTGGAPIVGVPYRLSVNAFDATRAARRAPEVQFSLSDSLRANITAAGMIVGIRPGPVLVRVSAGGWWSDSMTVVIRSNTRDTLAAEHWAHGLEQSWLVFGEPRATIVSDGRGRRNFTTAGDGQFHSGALTAADYSSSGGLTLSTTISTPVTLGQWQELDVELHAGLDTAKVRSWNSRAGYLWNDGRMQPVGPLCGFKYPGGAEGTHYADLAAISGAHHALLVRAPAFLRTGRPVQLKLQLFPDGRCGVALDGVALAVNAETSSIVNPARILLLGNSYQTTVLVGPLTLTRGVDTTIAWDRVPP